MQMNKVDTINLLQHDDKWHLGGWEHILCAPAFTSWLHIPGLWDDASHYNHSIFSLFTIAVLDEQGHDVCLRLDSQIWCPDTQFYDAGICNSRRALELKRE